jgi:hypothetical protein
MTRAFGFALIFSLLSLAAVNARAQIFNQGVVTTSGQYTGNTGTVGAVGNRNAANQIYQQSLADEAQGRATLNIGLMSKSLTEAQQGIQADNQAHSFAQNSLGGVDSGGNSGNLDLSKFNSIGVSDMKDLATTSSPMYPSVASKLASYGMNFSEDKQYMQTPTGTYPVGSDPSQIAAAIKSFAASKGLDTSQVDAGVKAGLEAAANITQQALADAAAKLQGGASSAGHIADGSGANDGKGGAAGGATDADGKDKAARQMASAASGLTGNLDDKGVNWGARELSEQEYREKLLKELGHDPIGLSSQNIFDLIHARYEVLKTREVFIRTSPPSRVTADAKNNVHK